MLRRRALAQPDDLAYRFLLDGDSSEVLITYGALDERARRIAATLLSLCAPGDRALLMYPAGIDFIAAWFGCAYTGVIPVTVPPPHPARAHSIRQRIGAIAQDAAPAVILTSTLLHQALRDVPLTAALADARWLATDADLDEPMVAVADDPDASDIAFLQYTSGSTSEPRGVVVTHENLTDNLHAILAAFTRPGDQGSVCWLPAYHDMGLVGGILGPIAMGAPATLLSPAAFVQRPMRWLAAITRYHAAISGGPNFAYELCTKKITAEQRNMLDLSSWRCAFNGAEPIDPATLRAFTEQFAPCGFDDRALTPCYGLAESTLLVAATPHMQRPVVRTADRSALAKHQVVTARDPADAQELVSCGPPISNVAIVDVDTGRRCSPGKIGEIWVAGASVAAGYWNRPAESESVFRGAPAGELGAYLRTGDLGAVLDGELYVTGRIKDLIIVDGVNHYPQDIERTVGACHDALASGECAALAIDEQDREAVVIVAGLRRAPAGAAADITRAIRTAVAEVHGVAVLDVTLVQAGSLPRTSSGKLRRHACRAAWIDGTLAKWEHA